MPRIDSKSKPGTSSRSSGSRAGTSGGDHSRRIKRRISSDEDSENDSHRPTQSNPNRNETLTAVNVTNNATLVNNMVKYFLNYSATKIPIKKSDINKCLKIHFKLFPEILASCIETLKNVYGLEVLEIDEKSGKMFIVYSSLTQGVSAEQLSPDQRSEASLLFLILSYIFMKGGDVQEGTAELILVD